MKYFRINHNIRIPEARIIDADGNNLGVMPLHQALKLAQEKNLDLIEVGPQAKPPVCKITDYGKFLYTEQKKAKKPKRSKLKTVKIGFNTGTHDIEVKAKQASGFLEKGYPVRVDLFLRGREKGQKHLAKGKIEELLKFITIDFKVESEYKFYPNGINLIVTKK